MPVDDSYGVEIVEDGDGFGGYEFRNSFEGPGPDEVPESPNDGSFFGSGSGNPNLSLESLLNRKMEGNWEILPDAEASIRSLQSMSELRQQESLSPQPYPSFAGTVSQDESFRTSTRGMMEASDRNLIRSGSKQTSNPDAKRLPSQERQKRTRRQNICILVVAVLLVGITCFLVYYLVAGKNKASLRSSQSQSSATMIPTISASPTGPPVILTEGPTQSPSGGPTAAPTFPPEPSASPTSSPTQFDEVVEPLALIAFTERDVREMIANDPLMGPKFVRLGFHDCVGFCDGCVDMSFADNLGLETPIDALAPIVALYERPEANYTRADIWALAALVAADIAQNRSDTKVDFRMQFIGRQNCEVRFNNQCFDEDGVTLRNCSATLGPFHHLPPADITTADIFHFFNNEFGFTDKETVAIMGAHTIGAMHRENSGINGINGWVRDNLLLDHDYYKELVGGSSLDDSIEDLVETAPPWLRTLEDNSDLQGFSDKAVWEAFPPSFENPDQVERIVMLNADIALVRELNETNLLSDGKVMCAFISSVGGATPRCPHAERSLMFAAAYRFDNDLWLNDFRTVFHKMLNHGCSDMFCNIDAGGVCQCTL